MKIIDKILWIEFADFLAAGWQEDSIKKSNLRNGSFWMMMADPGDRRRVLVQYETLRQAHKDKLTAHFGNPYEFMSKEPIRALVKPDHKAQEYYTAYQYTDSSGNLRSLPLEHQQKYSQAAAWLNMLIELDSNKEAKKAIKKQLNLDLTMLYAYLGQLFKAEDIWLPTRYPKIREKIAEYKSKGYDCFIDWRFGNQLAAKVKDEVSETALLELISMPNQHDNSVIARAYNTWAVKNNYKTIDPATVAVHRRKNMHLLQGEIHGNAAWYNNFGKIIHRNRPSAPLLLIGSDDNDLDLYFVDNRRNSNNHYFRFKLVVVMDAHNDYVLGYSYGDTVTAELVKAAYLDALYHVRELTGDWYLMDQIQSDRFAFKALEPFYQSLATYTPARAKAPRGKFIEQAFGKKWHQVLKMFPNYAGHNITAKSKLNRDNIELQKKDFPTVDQGPQLIENFIHCMRMLKDASGRSRQETWLANFQASEKSKRHLISEERMLTLLGEPHEHTHRITNGGIRATIGGNQYVYEIPEDVYLANVGKTVQLYIDHYDHSRVLVSDGANVRFIAREFQKMPSALADFQEGDHKRLHTFLGEKKRHAQHIADKKDKRKQIAERMQIDAESMLQASVLVKGIKQSAELNYQRAMLNDRAFDNYDPLDM